MLGLALALSVTDSGGDGSLSLTTTRPGSLLTQVPLQVRYVHISV
jgi:hypothetical protein